VLTLCQVLRFIYQMSCIAVHRGPVACCAGRCKKK